MCLSPNLLYHRCPGRSRPPCCSVPIESVSYVRCLIIDYSKAFDTIVIPPFSESSSVSTCYPISLHGFANLTGRTHSVIFGGVLSHWKPITASIVQGSGIEPCLFIVYTMDLKPHSSFNTILKYADDTTLLVPPELLHHSGSRIFSHP